MSTNILENLTENTELLEAKDVKKKCRHCALWTKWCSTVGQRSRKCIAPTENQYYSKIKLWGHPEEYLEIKYVKAIKTDGLAQMVWEWIEQLMVTGNGKRYLTTCMSLMKEGLTDKAKFEENKETIINYGPDNHQLKVARELQEDIKYLWWQLVKYQYNKRKDAV